MGEKSTRPTPLKPRKAASFGVGVVFVGLLCVLAAYLSLPAAIDLWDDTAWGYGYRFDFRVVDGRCVPIEHAPESSFGRSDGAVYSVENFGTPIFEAPPLLGWLWKPRLVGLDVATRHVIVWPERAGEPLPADLPDQLTVLVQAAIESRRDRDGVMDGRKLDLAHEMCLPVGVTPGSGRVQVPRPHLSVPVPRTRLTVVTLFMMLGVACVAAGGLTAAHAVRVSVRSSRRRRVGRCVHCGYPLNGLRKCPECGEEDSDTLHAP